MAYSQSPGKRGEASAGSGVPTRPPADKRTADPRWRRTRARLLTVGFELIGEAGTDGVSIDAIIARAFISKQTFYNHFADRDIFTEELWLESRRVFELAITRANAGVADPVERLARGVAIYARLAMDDPPLAKFVARTNIRRSVIEAANQGLKRDLVDGVEQGRLRFDSVATAAMFVTGVTWALIAQILASHDPTQPVARCRETLTMLLLALGFTGDDGGSVASDAARDMVGMNILDL